MKEPLSLELVARVIDAEGIVRSSTTQKYEHMSEADVVATQHAMLNALTGLGFQKTGTKPPVDPGRPGGGPAKP